MASHRLPALCLVASLSVGVLPALRAADDVSASSPESAIDPGAVKNLEAAYPRAPAGKERKVILLPHKERGEEDDFQVELVVGRTMVTDGINAYRLGGRIVPRDIEGWGFTYHDVEGDLQNAAQTLVGGPENPAPRFVAGPRTLVPYNSRLPVVVMVPEGCELKWRVWRAAPDLKTAESR